MTSGAQEIVAFGILGLTLAAIAWRALRSILLPPLARGLLKSGRVGWAMRVRAWSGARGCHDGERS